MPDITMHLSANFYPPIPADIQLSVQEFFDEFVDEAGPYIIGWSDIPEDWEYEIANEDALNNEWELPNGRIIKAQHMLDELRLWDAIWYDCTEPEESYAGYLRWQESLKEDPNQLTLEIS